MAQPARQGEPQRKSTITVEIAVGQSHGFDTVDNMMHIGMIHDEHMIPVLVTVGQWVSIVGVGVVETERTPSLAGAAATCLTCEKC